MMDSVFDIPYANDSFRDIDIAFAQLLARLAPDDPPSVALAALLVSRAAGEGHVCLDLQQWHAEALPEGHGQTAPMRCPPVGPWIDQLHQSSLVGQTTGNQPLVCDRRGRVYLQRLYRHEQELAARLRHRASAPAALPAGVDSARGRTLLSRYFPAPPHPEDPEAATDWQKIAALVAVLKQLCIISGAPGTGKTTTVAKIIGLLMELAAPHPLRVSLCAPTGKAAARLAASLAEAGRTLDCTPPVAAALSSLEPGTIHRLLRFQPSGRGFGFNEAHPLPADLVVVDEASMVDLVLMSRLVRAVPDHARLIILGDKDQLASVEAGAVFGDLCRGASHRGCSRRMRDVIATLSLPAPEPGEGAPPSGGGALQDCIIVLRKNYRFASQEGIGALTLAVNRGDGNAVKRLLGGKARTEIRWERWQERAEFHKLLAAYVLKGYETYLESEDPLQALERFGSFRILCALAKGPFGADHINHLARDILLGARRIRRGHPWYPGRPVMITRNDYRMGLFNGDTGIAWPDKDGRLRVWFQGAGARLRALSPRRLPAHQTVFAMTVHKSQGSEFDRVLLILPDRDAPVLTRELMYTGCSRARRQLALAAREAILDQALSRTVRRTSGLAEALGEA